MNSSTSLGFTCALCGASGLSSVTLIDGNRPVCAMCLGKVAPPPQPVLYTAPAVTRFEFEDLKAQVAALRHELASALRQTGEP